MIAFAEAVATALSRAFATDEEHLPLQDALGRFIARDLVAESDNPRFDNSSVDGFAVRAADTGGALALHATIAAGRPWDGALPAEGALKIMTGAPLPEGADAVLMIEDARVDGGRVVALRPVERGENVRLKGGEFRTGETLLRAGTAVTPPVVALLASLGLTHAAVRRPPRVALITTGCEIASPGEALRPGQIYDANREGLTAALRPLGIRPEMLVRCPDEVSALRGSLAEAFQRSEVVLTTGGVSMGDFDLVREAATSLGLQPVFWKIALKPGKPTFFGTFPRPAGPDGLFFGLVGNPVGALLGFQTLVRPVLERMMGAVPAPAPALEARLTAPLTKPKGRLELVRGRLGFRDGALEVTPIPARESHMILGLARADCVLHLPREAERVEAGALVEVEALRWA